jgi:hypothetical protein
MTASITKTAGTIAISATNLNGVDFFEKELVRHDYFVGKRDPLVKPEFEGAFMVNDPQDGEDGFAIVGDDKDELVREAYSHLLAEI